MSRSKPRVPPPTGLRCEAVSSRRDQCALYGAYSYGGRQYCKFHYRRAVEGGARLAIVPKLTRRPWWLRVVLRTPGLRQWWLRRVMEYRWGKRTYKPGRRSEEGPS